MRFLETVRIHKILQPFFFVKAEEKGCFLMFFCIFFKRDQEPWKTCEVSFCNSPEKTGKTSGQNDEWGKKPGKSRVADLL